MNTDTVWRRTGNAYAQCPTQLPTPTTITTKRSKRRLHVPLHNDEGLRLTENMKRDKRRYTERPSIRTCMFVWLAILLCWIALLFVLKNDAARPTKTTSACQLHYSRFHLLWTFPPLVVLFLLTRPFLTKLDRHKLAVLPLIALVWTTPWDNELVRQGAWWYPASCVAARIGYVPVEEYAFFVLQSWITTLFTIFVTRWLTPKRATQTGNTLAPFVPLVPLTTMIVGFVGLNSPDGFARLYYISMIAWWSSVPLILLWFGTRQTWIGLLVSARSAISWLACIMIPTVYLCCADIYALRRGTWHIEERKSLQLFPVPDLPLEEATFFFVTNLILVSACLAFDRVVWQMRCRQVSEKVKIVSPTSPTYFQLDKSTIPAIWNTFLHLDQKRDERVDDEWQEAQVYALSILRKASKSFHVASKLLPWDLRTDLGCIYAFARAMDDFIDTPPEADSKKDNVEGRISLLRALVKATFAPESQCTYADTKKQIEACFDNFAPLTTCQRTDLSMSALAASILRGIIPLHLWNELIEGYATDNQPNGPHFANFEAQADYAQNVAGSIGEMCVRVVLARSGVQIDREHRTTRDVRREDLTGTARRRASGRHLNDKEPYARILRDARRMGVSLQLVNIARDIVDDATTLRRCYLSLTEKEAGLRAAIQSGSMIVRVSEDSQDRTEESQVEETLSASLSDVDAETIFGHKIGLLNTAEEIYAASVGSIDAIPDVPSQVGFRVACAVYVAIGKAIRRDGKQGCARRSRLSTFERIMVAIKATYFKG